MDHLWTPWRYAYVTTADKAKRQGVPAELSDWPGDLDCVFCNMIVAVDYAIAHGMNKTEAEGAAGIVQRGPTTFVCLNAYPYASGHVMVLPYSHLGSLAALEVPVAHELMETAQRTERVLTSLYSPHGMNLGMNLGKAGGAGVAGHLHLHVLPRWLGDTNFLTVVAETRILPEDLKVTWARMHEAFQRIG
jgi:ATP adenylyltransferase